MADRPKPIVRLLMILRRASTDAGTAAWILREPLTTVTPPAGSGFPFRQREAAVYTQLTGGLGRWELAVEFGQRLDHGTFRVIGQSRSVVRAFGPAARLAVWELAFALGPLPFRGEGLYEFRIVGRPADDSDGSSFEVLDGTRPDVPAVAELRALDLRGQP
jgi:hypothetical protein